MLHITSFQHNLMDCRSNNRAHITGNKLWHCKDNDRITSAVDLDLIVYSLQHRHFTQIDRHRIMDASKIQKNNRNCDGRMQAKEMRMAQMKEKKEVKLCSD